MTQQAGKEEQTTKGVGAAIRRGTLFGVVANLTQVATRLVTVPIIIAHMGLDGYGIWNVVNLTATYLRFGSVGVKSAFQTYVAQATGHGDYERASHLLSTGCGLMFAVSLIGVVPAMVFAQPLVRAAGVPPHYIQSAAHAVSILAFVFSIANVGAVFEAMVTGAQRIDLVRKVNTVLSVIEACATATALSFGFGLAAMAAVMGASELAFILWCYWASRRVIPQIQIRWRFMSWAACPELIRFAGSFQLLNALEVVYMSVVPFAVLRAYGAGPAGVYAVATRVVWSAGILQDAFLTPLLSAGASVYASGSAERMRDFIVKAFRTTLGLSIVPLGCVAASGATLVYAWTGEIEPSLGMVIGLTCLRAVFHSLSMLALVLYRTSGSALYDNIRQVLRIVLMIGVALVAKAVGFITVLAALAIVEFLGLVLMVLALKRTFVLLPIGRLLTDAGRFVVAAGFIAAGGAAATLVPLWDGTDTRSAAFLQLVQASIGWVSVAYPAAVWTGAVTSAEREAFVSRVRSRGSALLRRPAKC